MAGAAAGGVVGGAVKRVGLSLGLPGAGILIFWQLGVLHGLRQRFDLSRIPLLGSSSGAVAASLGASGACLEGAAARGVDLFKQEQHAIARRPFGMVGVLGSLVNRWLHDTLPVDAAARCSAGRASLLVTTLPLLRTRAISEFTCRTDLIRVVLASAHIPLLLDWRMFVNVKGSACIDGGLWWLLKRSLVEHQHAATAKTLIIKPCDDPGLAALNARRHSILARPTEAGVASEMWDRGLAYAERIAEAHEADLAPYLLASYLPHPSGAGAGAGAGVGSGIGVVAGAGGGVVLSGLPLGVH
ncbi:hypothetical protein FOA52_015760 [Chlamydomonas sp. UWO 241]|nr:hypothetical protein FOA52_015760 [Chlamydomonas sp. UWO 241]